MARARNIKPGFFRNEELAELEPLARILFAGLWTVADRSGRLEDRPKRIKADVLPYDDGDVDALLEALTSKGFITRYRVGADRFIQVVNFEQHQNPHKNETPSVIPEPYEHSTSTVQELDKDGSAPADSLNSDSLNSDLITETTSVVSPSAGAEDHPPPATKSALDQRFDRFWSVVPRKVGKDAALRWWRRTKPSDELTETMVQAMERHKRSPEWLENGGKWIPHPMTWLSRGGWNDELGPVESELDNAYVVAFGSDNVQRMAAALDRLDSTFAGAGWLRSTLRRMVVDSPGLTPEQIKAGMAIALERIELRVRNREKPVTNPTSFAYFAIRQALDEQREASAT